MPLPLLNPKLIDPPTLANMLAESPAMFADWLAEKEGAIADDGQHRLSRNDLYADVLLLYARDRRSFPDPAPLRADELETMRGAYEVGAINLQQLRNRVEPSPDRLFAADFTEAALGLWLEVMADRRRSEAVTKLVVREFNNGGQAYWHVEPNEIGDINLHHLTPDRARRDLQERVLRMFPEVERIVSATMPPEQWAEINRLPTHAYKRVELGEAFFRANGLKTGPIAEDDIKDDWLQNQDGSRTFTQLWRPVHFLTEKTTFPGRRHADDPRLTAMPRATLR